MTYKIALYFLMLAIFGGSDIIGYMKVLTIGSETQRNISKVVGADLKDILTCDPIDEAAFIHKTLRFSKKRDLRRIGRGNPLLSRRKIRTIADVDKRLSNIK